MKPGMRLLVALQIGAAIVLVVAAVQGQATIVPGLSIPMLAHDDIGLAVMAVGIVSCLLATVFVASFHRSRRPLALVALVIASAVAWLSASAFENARGLTFNGASRHWFSWPIMLWLLAIWAGLLVSAAKAGRDAA